MEHEDTLKNESWVDAKAVQKYFSIPKSTFEMWFRRGMPCLRFNKARRFKLSAVEAWMKEQNEISTKESK